MSRNQNLHGNISEKSELLWPSLNVGIKTTDLSQAYNDNRHSRIKKLVVTKLKVEEVHTLGHRTSINSQKKKKTDYILYVSLLVEATISSMLHCKTLEIIPRVISQKYNYEWMELSDIFAYIHQHHLIQELLSRTIIPNTRNITIFSIWAEKKSDTCCKL